MKSLFLKTASSVLLLLFVVCCFSSCNSGSGLKLSSCELIETGNGTKGIFRITNYESTTTDKLKITVDAFDGEQKNIGTFEGSYSLYVDPDHEATITVLLPDECKKAKAISYEYSVDGKQKSGTFDEDIYATFAVPTTEDTKIDTRKELADKLIDDIEHQFMLQHYEAHGYYDEEKNQVVIASYTTKTYDECKYSYSVEPEIYSELAKSIRQMSLTCYEEFQNYNFKDVEVSVGFLSSDEKIMISATNGEIVDNFN